MSDAEQPAVTPAPAALPRSVKIVSWASLLNDTASEMTYPLLPQFLLESLHGSKLYLGVIEGMADAVASFVKLWSGNRSDQVGQRKQFIVFGYSVPALVRPLMSVIVAPWQLFGIRIVDRMGKGVRSSPRDALIADSTDSAQRGRAFGFHRAMDNLGAAIGPLLAASFLWLWPNQLRTLFLITFLPGMAVVLLLALGLREAGVTTTSRPDRFRWTLKPFDRKFRVYLLALATFTLGNASDAFLLVRAGELGVPTIVLPFMWCLCHVVKSLGNLVLGRVVDRIGSRATLFVGWLAFAGVYLAFGYASTVEQIWTLFAAYGLVVGLFEPAERTLVAELVGAERKGLAYGWYNFSIGITTLPASLCFGALYQSAGPLTAFALGATLAVLAAGMLLIGVRQTPRN